MDTGRSNKHPMSYFMYVFIFIDTEPGVFIIVKKFSLLYDHCGNNFEKRGKSAHSLKPPKRSCYIEGGKINVVKNRPSFGLLDSAR